MGHSPEIKTLSSKIVYSNRWMRVREDTISRQDDSQGIYGVVEKADFAVVAPFDGEQLFLVQQYRYPVGARFWEFPQGSLEKTSFTPLEIATTELREETGLSAGNMAFVGRLYAAYGFANQACHIFLATNLVCGEPKLEAEEQGLICRGFPVSEVAEMILDGTITDAITVAAFGLLRMKAWL